MKSPLRSSSLFGYRPSDYLGGSRIENIYHLRSNLHVGTGVLFLPGLEMLCHQDSLPFWELHDLSSTSSHLFFLFSYSFLCVVLEEGSDFFHSQCKTAENRVSAV